MVRSVLWFCLSYLCVEIGTIIVILCISYLELKCLNLREQRVKDSFSKVIKYIYVMFGSLPHYFASIAEYTPEQ